MVSNTGRLAAPIVSSKSLALRGIAALILGAIALTMPSRLLIGLMILFGVYALVSGALALFSAITKRVDGRGWLFLEGLVGVGAGLITLLWPGLTALLLTYVIAIWAIFTGIFEIAGAIRLRRHIRNEWLYLIGGALAIILGALVMLQPQSGALAITWILGVYGIILGSLLLGLSVQVRQMERTGVRPDDRRAA